MKFSRNKILSPINIIIAVITMISAIFYVLTANNLPTNAPISDLYDVVHIADGDTITVKDSNGAESKVRLLYVDTPETVKPNTAVQCYGKNASNYTKQLLTGKKVKLERDVEGTDVYDRLLRYVYVDENNDGKYEEMLNKLLLEQGYAKVYKPSKGQQKNVKYKQILDEAENTAKTNNVGLWGECK